MTSPSEFHDLSELALNQDGQSWGNLGFWQDGNSSYSEACRELALRLGTSAHLDDQSVVFDAGFGCGDQLNIWLEHFHIADICGVNLSKSQTKQAQIVLASGTYSAFPDSISQGDIDEGNIWRQVIQNRKISHIVALDCVYHFASRLRFLQYANTYLSNLGMIALTDFMLADQFERNSLKHRLLLLMLKLSRIPAFNIVSKEHYRSQLEDNGFTDVKIDDISQPVMFGFGNWYIEARKNRRTRLSIKARMKYRLTAAFLQWAYRHSVLRYCLISATKRDG